jgi:hypothetical protein
MSKTRELIVVNAVMQILVFIVAIISASDRTIPGLSYAVSVPLHLGLFCIAVLYGLFLLIFGKGLGRVLGAIFVMLDILLLL